MRLPLRLRLVLAFSAGTLLVMAGFGAFLYMRLGHDLLAGVDMDLRARAQVIAGTVAARDTPFVRSQGRLLDPDEAFAQVLSPSGRILDSSSGVAGHPMVSGSALPAGAGPKFLTTRVRGVDDPARLLLVPQKLTGRRVFVVVGATLGDRKDALARLLLELGIAGPIAVVLVSAAGWGLAGGALRPVERMRREAAAMSVSEPSRRLPVPDPRDELARLAVTLNDLLDRRQDALRRRRLLRALVADLPDLVGRAALHPILLEVKVAELAAVRSTPAEVAALKALARELDSVGREGRDYSAFLENDWQLHMALAELGRNAERRRGAEIDAVLAAVVLAVMHRDRGDFSVAHSGLDRRKGRPHRAVLHDRAALHHRSTESPR